MTANLNLLIQQGATLQTSLSFYQTLTTRKNLKAGEITLYTEPLTSNLTTGLVLDFGTIDVILASPATIGSTAITIVPHTGSTLPIGSNAPTIPENLTGKIYRGQVRKTYKDTSPLIALTFNTVPLAGIVSLSIAAPATATLTPNAIYSDLPLDVRLISDSAIPPKILTAAYYWDVESELEGIVDRVVQGRCWVTSEATR